MIRGGAIRLKRAIQSAIGSPSTYNRTRHRAHRQGSRRARAPRRSRRGRVSGLECGVGGEAHVPDDATRRDLFPEVAETARHLAPEHAHRHGHPLGGDLAVRAPDGHDHGDAQRPPGRAGRPPQRLGARHPDPDAAAGGDARARSSAATATPDRHAGGAGPSTHRAARATKLTSNLFVASRAGSSADAAPGTSSRTASPGERGAVAGAGGVGGGCAGGAVVGRRARTTSKDTVGRSSCGSGSATAESTANSSVRAIRAPTASVATGISSVVDSDGISCGRSHAGHGRRSRRSSPATRPGAGGRALRQLGRQPQQAAARRAGVGDLDRNRRHVAAGDLRRGGRGHGLVGRRGRRRDAEDLDLHRVGRRGALVVGDRRRDRVLALAEPVGTDRERRAAAELAVAVRASTRSRRRPASGRGRPPPP